MKKIISSVLSAVTALIMLSVGLNAAALSYNAGAALSYAANHWNDGVGLCATFVSNCINAGGCTVSSSTVTGLNSLLVNSGYCTKYELTKTSTYYVYESTNSGKIAAGDPILFYCKSCGGWQHAALCAGFDSSDRALLYGHNPAWQANRATSIGGYVDAAGHTGASIIVYSYRMIGDSSVGTSIRCIKEKDTISNTNAVLWAQIDKPTSAAISEIGITVRKMFDTYANGWSKYDITKRNYVGSTYTQIFYDMNGELGVTLSPGVEYAYQFYAKVDGKAYFSEEGYFKTNGTHTHQKGSFLWFEARHPHCNDYSCLTCGQAYTCESETNVWEECDICFGLEKSNVTLDKSVYEAGDNINVSWTPVDKATHYNLQIEKKDENGIYTVIEAKNNLKGNSISVNGLEPGEYRIYHVTYNSNMWEKDKSDWRHTASDYVYFSVIKETQSIPKNGQTLVFESGVWKYVSDGELAPEYTGLVKYYGTWYYVENGILNWNYTGLTNYYGTWYYVEGGILNWSYTGLTNFYGTWYYVDGGILNWGYTGLTNYGGTWYYVEGGILNWGYTGLTNYYGTWYYVEGSILNWGYTGLINYYGTWYYVADGVLDWNYTGSTYYYSTWYYVRNGVLA